MIVDIINGYLKSNRRLVIPSFGAFLAKEDGEIIFSELLKKDDGVLREVMMSKGRSEIEVAGAIDRFIFEVRHDLQNTGICLVEGLGTFRRTEDGLIAFERTLPAAVVEPEVVVKPQPIAEPEPPVTPVVPKTPVRPTPLRGGKPQRKSNNFIMWFAGIVIVAALCALAYGLYCMWSAPEREDIDAQMDAQRIPMIEVPNTTN